MFEFLLVVLIIYIVLVILIRFVFPFLIKRFVKRVQRNLFEQNDNYQNQHYESTKNGEINVDFIPPKSKTSTDNVGEYVDYEEIK